MMDTPDIVFHISNQGMDPGQDLRRFFPRTGCPATHDEDREKHPGSFKPGLIGRGFLSPEALGPPVMATVATSGGDN